MLMDFNIRLVEYRIENKKFYKRIGNRDSENFIGEN